MQRWMSHGIACVGPLFVCAATAWASGEAALRTSAQAQNQFYKEMRALGPHPSTQDVESLKTRILVPAAISVGKSVHEDLDQTKRDVSTQVYESLKRNPKLTALMSLEAFEKWGQKLMGRDSFDKSFRDREETHFDTGNSTLDYHSGPQQNVSFPPAVPSQPEVVIDGSNVPREINFPGPKNKPSQVQKIKGRGIR